MDLLAERRISAVPVVDADRRVVGVVSEADLLYQVEFAGAVAERRVFPGRHQPDREKSVGRTARELMTAPAVTARRGTTLAAAARVMDDRLSSACRWWTRTASSSASCPAPTC